MNKIFNENCLETMQRTELENKVDLVITSPPYNMTNRKGGYADKSKRYDVYEDWKTENDVYGSFEQVEVKSDGLRYPRSVQYFKTAESEGKTWHKTQKPKDLCKYIIETYSKQGDVVLDFTAGSGTSAIGIEIGRTVVLVEKNLNEFEKLKERWKKKLLKRINSNEP